MERPLDHLVFDLLAAKSDGELVSVLGAIRERGEVALRATAAALAERALSLRLQRAAIALGAELRGEEGTRLLLALAANGCDEEERASAVRALAGDDTHETLTALLPTLSTYTPGYTDALSDAVVQHLGRVASGFDWSGPVRALEGSSLNPVLAFVREEASPPIPSLCAALDAERRSRRHPFATTERFALHRSMGPSRDGRVHNPYLAEFEAFCAAEREALEREDWSDRSPSDAQERMPRRPRGYAYAVPTEAALDLLASCAPIVEIGAGTGYWAWLLRQRGVDIVAYDREPPDGTYRNDWFEGCDVWTEVLEGGAERIARHADRALFLCWPPDARMAEECLEAFAGETVIFAGAWREAYATPGFFDELEARFGAIAEVPLPSRFAEETLRVFHRR